MPLATIKAQQEAKVLKNIIILIIGVMLPASVANAGQQEDEALLQYFIDAAASIGETTAMIRACGYIDKADDHHNTFMETATSLMSTQQDRFQLLIENYESGVAAFQSTLAQRGTPPDEVCKILLE